MHFCPDFFFPKKMELEKQKQIKMLEEGIICLKAAIIREKKNQTGGRRKIQK